MKLTVLCDNNTFIDQYLLAEPALSFYIENEQDKILFDVGYSNVYKENATKLNIDLSNINKIVFSHGHDDHTRGIAYFDYETRPQLYYCDGCFDKRRFNSIEVGFPYNISKIKKHFNLVKIDSPTEISPNLYFLGPIPRVNNFEKDNANFYIYKRDGWVEDFCEDDSALVYVGKEGLSIITGCSHSGICNICEYAKKLFNKKIQLIIGGLHLFENNKKTQKSINYLKRNKIPVIYPCHCTSLCVKTEMLINKLNVKEVASGLKLDIL